jgi:hypothetical protein
MNQFQPLTHFRNPVLIIAALTCLNHAQAHPGHEHDGGAVHVASHGIGWLAGIALVAVIFWAMSRGRRSATK